MEDLLRAGHFHPANVERLDLSPVELAVEQDALAKDAIHRLALQPLEPLPDVNGLIGPLTVRPRHPWTLLETRTIAGSVAAITAAPFTASILRTILIRTFGSPR